MGDRNPEKQISQTEIALAALREAPLHALVKEGIESAYTSKAERTDKGLRIETTNDRDKSTSTMIIEGTASSEHRTINLSGIHFDTILRGEYTISHVQGKTVKLERDQFELIGTDWDAWMSRPDRFTLTMKRTDAQGRPIQTYEPAISETQVGGDGHLVLDPNGQPLRIARPADGEANCGLENIGNPGNRRMDATFIIRDATLGDLSYNQTREKEPAGWYYRSVVRDMKGTVLGIVSQRFTLDDNGDIESVTTSARKPRKTL